MSNEEYTSLKVSQFVNIWMPLNLRLEAYPLAIMDIRTIKSTQETLAIYQDRRLNGGDVYYSVGVVPHESQQWYVKNEMELGEAVIFDSCLTPHTAVRFPDQGEKQRTSIECRVIFL